MTSMLERPADAPARESRSRADVVATLPVAAVTAAVWAAGVGLLLVGVVVSLAWAVSSRGDDGLTTPLRASGALWLLAHHVPVLVGSTTITLLPLLLLVLPLLLLARAGRWAARITSTSTWADAVLLVLTGSVFYAFLAFLVSQSAGIADATFSPATATVHGAVVAALGLGGGVLQATGLARPLVERLPMLVRRAAVAVTASGAALVALVGAVAIVAVLSSWSAVTGLTHELAPGAWDAVGILLLSLVYLPNLLVWTLAYVVGPGFLVGGGVGVDPFSTTGGLLPGAPLLAAVPQEPPAVAPLLLLLPVLAGCVGAAVLRRRGRLDLPDELLVDLAAAVALGVVSGLLAALSGGALGADRLAALGPHPVAVAAAVTGLTLAGSMLWTLVGHALPSIWVRAEHP